MTDRELMQMALDALEAQFYTDGRAIKALRDRLAQPEQESAIPAGVISAIRNAGLTLVRTQQGYVLQRIEGIKAQPEPYKQPEDNRLLMKAYRAIQEKQPESEPVAIGEEWKPCVKLPIVVHVREQRKGETHVSTREGITPVKEDDLIMRGVAGEEYPIGRELFNSTYTFDTAPVHTIDISQERVDETAKREQEPVAWHEPGAYGNVTTHKDWALANGWEPLYSEKT